MAVNYEHSFGFLVSDISRLMREHFNEAAQKLGLTLAQSRALFHLARNEGVNQATLARLLEIQPITLLRQLDRLEENQLIERRPDPSDRRATRLFLAPAAKPLLEELTVIGRAMTDTAFAGISEGDRNRVIAMLEGIKDNLAHGVREADESRQVK